MYQNVFERVEEKYLLNEKQKLALLQKIKVFLREDEFYKSTICNIYFDNTNHDLIIQSLDKPIFKEKIRLRSYGTPTLKDDVFLEIKRKYRGVVGKRRIKMSLKEFYNYLENNQYDDSNQIMKEIDYCFKYYNLKPRIYIAYDRESYKGMEDSNLRITFDSNLRSRNEDLRLELGDCGKKYFDDDYYLMEIKTLGSIPMWLIKTLSELNIYPISFSKYGKIYIKNKKGELIYAE